MTTNAADIARNLDNIRERIAHAAAVSGRAPESVRLVAVTKTVGIEAVEALVSLGVTEMGENRVMVARDKIPRVAAPVRWHMIGAIQRRKAAEIVSLFDTVDAVDRFEVAEALERRCGEQAKHMDVLVEVNVSGEASKHGFAPDALEPALARLRQMEHLNVAGLMTMAPFVADPEEARPVFAQLRVLAERFGLAELSMGMTNDYEVAIEEGATQVRIGTALFS